MQNSTAKRRRIVHGRAARGACTYFLRNTILKARFKRFEDTGEGRAFDADVAARDATGLRHYKVREIPNAAFENACSSFFGTDKNFKFRAAFDERICFPGQLSEDDKMIILAQVGKFAGGNPAQWIWEPINAAIALRIVAAISRTRMHNSKLFKACTKNWKNPGGDRNWDIGTHAEAAPENGPGGTVQDGIHALVDFSDLKCVDCFVLGGVVWRAAAESVIMLYSPPVQPPCTARCTIYVLIIPSFPHTSTPRASQVRK